MIFLLSGSSPNFHHETGLEMDDAFLLKSGKSQRIFGYRMNLDFDRKIFSKTEPFDMKKILKLVKGKEVGMDFANESAKFCSEISKSAKKVVDIGEDCLTKRSFKTEEEIALLKASSKKAKSIINNIDVKKGMAEIEIANALKKEVIDQGLGLSFEPIVATGANSSYPHSVPTNKKVGSFVMIDFGVKYRHYCSDMTEVIFLDRKSKEFELYGRIKEAFGSVFDGLRGCETGNDIHLAYLRAFKRLGLPTMPHGIGHGVGLEVHEYPRLKKGSKDRTRGTVFTLEPAIYLKNRFGLRFEREILVKKSGKAEVI